MLKTLCVGTVCAETGTKKTGILPIPEKFAGELLPVDVIVVNGREDGPVVYIGAGTHGDEFNSMEACRKAALALDPQVLKGAVIFAPCHNNAALANCCRHSPADGKDLDDCFPGDLNGTPSDALAYIIFHEALLKADYMIDMHTASKNGCNIRYGTISPVIPEVRDRSYQLVKDFGGQVVFELKKPGPGEYLGQETGWNYSGNLFAQAHLQGIPGSIIEYGEAGRLDLSQIDAAVQGIFNMLKGLNMLEGEVEEYSPIFIRRNLTIRSEKQGLFYCYKEPGELVKKGMLLGEIVTYPDKLTRITAPCDGIVLRIATEALVKQDVRLFILGIPEDQNK